MYSGVGQISADDVGQFFTGANIHVGQVEFFALPVLLHAVGKAEGVVGLEALVHGIKLPSTPKRPPPRP
jgi:hypothetical protein